jgi:camelysin-like metallo-endopeptidase
MRFRAGQAIPRKTASVLKQTRRAVDSQRMPKDFVDAAQKSRVIGRTSAWLIKAGAIGAGLAAVSLFVVNSTQAAFFASTANGGNSFTAGTVVLADDDSGTLMFNLSGMKPNDTATKCVNVTYTGSLAADVKLYGDVGGTGLADYLSTSIDVGTGATGGEAMSCDGFASSANLHNTTLAAFGAAHTNFGNGVAGFDGATNPSTRSYRVTVTLQDNNEAQGKNASAIFTWEAQNT